MKKSKVDRPITWVIGFLLALLVVGSGVVFEHFGIISDMKMYVIFIILIRLYVLERKARQ